jgi:hypothetical protein
VLALRQVVDRNGNYENDGYCYGEDHEERLHSSIIVNLAFGRSVPNVSGRVKQGASVPSAFESRHICCVEGAPVSRRSTTRSLQCSGVASRNQVGSR